MGWWTKWMKGSPFLMRVLKSYGLEPNKDIPSFIIERILEDSEDDTNKRMKEFLEDHGPLLKSEANAKWMTIYYQEIKSNALAHIDAMAFRYNQSPQIKSKNEDSIDWNMQGYRYSRKVAARLTDNPTYLSPSITRMIVKKAYNATFQYLGKYYTSRYEGDLKTFFDVVGKITAEAIEEKRNIGSDEFYAKYNDMSIGYDRETQLEKEQTEYVESRVKD